MKTEQIERALNLAARLRQAIVDAHSDACTEGTQLLEIALRDLIEPASNLSDRLIRIAEAIGFPTPPKTKKIRKWKRFITPDPYSESLKRKRKAISL